MVTALKGNFTTEDSRLDRLPEFDERSRGFPIRTLVSKRPRSYTWRIEQDYIIDQGTEGACVGFAMVNELQARPAEVDLGSQYRATQFAIENVYHQAQRIDPWDGGAYPGASPFYHGTSVLAGVKATKSHNFFDEYRWSFGLGDLTLGVGHNGPAIIGVTWYDSCYVPDKNGFIRPEGNIVGGHALLVRAVKIKWDSVLPWRHRTMADVDLDASYFTLRNSWGQWGHKDSGDCYVTLRDMERWLKDRGEAVFMVKRTVNP